MAALLVVLAIVLGGYLLVRQRPKVATSTLGLPEEKPLIVTSTTTKAEEVASNGSKYPVGTVLEYKSTGRKAGVVNQLYPTMWTVEWLDNGSTQPMHEATLDELFTVV